MIDLRSDTVTQPTPEMREAMAKAIVGDDVRGEDPTINRLQELAANISGKDAAIFVPSGTMGNLISILTQCGRGDEVILGNKSHVYLDEAGGISALGGIHPYPLPNQPDGTIELNDIQESVHSNDDPHHPNTKLIVLENTHNACGGKAITASYIDSIAEFAHAHSLRVHLDGARIFNAAVALHTPVNELVKSVDSVQFCLSKGLCAPVGSMLCGSKDFVYRAVRVRKQLGGGMRQAGILAAAGIIALEEMVHFLSDDHKRARHLALGLSSIPGLIIDPLEVQTNMLYITIANEIPRTAFEIGNLLESENIGIDVQGARKIRLVTHHGVDDNAIEQVLCIFRNVMAQIRTL